MTMRSKWIIAIAVCTQPGAALGSSECEFDPAGDAVIRRTDPGADGVLGVGAVLPDIVRVSVEGWSPIAPAVDPYTGIENPSQTPDFVRLELVFDGLVNPPGTLGLGATPFEPFAFGPSPVYGFVEIDVDRNRDTGGELGGAAALRVLATLARLGEIPSSSLSSRMAFNSGEIDSNFNTQPQYERSGQDFSLNLCGCFNVSVVDTFGDVDGSFDTDDMWVVRGRFFQRATGYEEASAAFGGSFFGLYDPRVDLRFRHDSQSDETTVTLVYPLTMQGAADLAGEPVQVIDLDVANHNSMIEALDDIVIGAGFPLFGPVATLTSEWANQDPIDSIDPTRWRINAVFATTYANIEPTLYVWTDAFGDIRAGDFDASGLITQSDVDDLNSEIASLDGSISDADGVTNGVVQFWNPGTDFSVFDLDGSGAIGAPDVAAISLDCLGDANLDGTVDVNDISFVLFRLGDADCSSADVNADEALDVNDISFVLFRLGNACP